jgi:VCBS repeat-containing protein
MAEPNQAPVGTNDAYTVAENEALIVPAPGVLANDSDPDADPLTAVLVTGPAHGQLSLAANGSFTYTPDTNFTGLDTFTYQAYDGLDTSDPVTVTITVGDGPPAGDYMVFMPVVARP